MPQLGELLERYRHAATPGPPAPGGAVPADAAADLEAELRPLLAELDEVDDEARSIAEAAKAGAAAVRDRGARDAEAILDEARRQAARLRTEPSKAGAGDAEANAILAAAASEADAIRRRGRQRIPGLVARMLACVAGAAVSERSDVAGVGRG